jgi:predicted anti-sigma-YlaC factor YlaD
MRAACVATATAMTVRDAHRLLLAGLAAAAMILAGGCSLRQAAVDRVADVVAQGGASYATDDDPELVRAAAPFSLKLTESLLAATPRHKGLLLAATRGFTQYAFAFVQQEADEVEDRDVAASVALQDRARRLYRRARDYGLRGLGLGQEQLRHEPRRTLAALPRSEAGLLYWTGAAWGALIGLSKSDPEALAELPIVEAMIDRALELDEGYEHGAIHTLLISLEMVRQGAVGDSAMRARRHFARSLELSASADAAPYVALAEAVCVPLQLRAEFQALLAEALRIEGADNRLANLVMQRRARWLLTRTDRLFID